MSIAARVRVQEVETLADDHFVLRKTRLAWRRDDGAWQEQSRETYDRGDAAALLACDVARRTVILTRQFRYAAFVNGHDDLMIEVPAGMLDGASPEDRVRAEFAEETGYVAGTVTRVFDAFTSPGGLTERVHCFVGSYDPGRRSGSGGGLAEEGEEIAVLETTIEEAMAMVAQGLIRDAKTIMLLQHAMLRVFPEPVRAGG